jgi:hypothetical protein
MKVSRAMGNTFPKLGYLFASLSVFRGHTGGTHPALGHELPPGTAVRFRYNTPTAFGCPIENRLAVLQPLVIFPVSLGIE